MVSPAKQVRVLSLLVLLLSVFCFDAGAETVLRVGGTGSGLASMKLLAKAFMKEHAAVVIKVVPSLGSAGGIAAVSQGALDLAVSGRPLKNCEQRSGTSAIKYARTPFVFATHYRVPKRDLTTDELVSIYAGKAQSWPGGGMIRLVLRPANDIDTAIVSDICPQLSRAVQQAHARPGMTVAITNQDSDETVAKVPGALGGSTLAEVVAERRRVKVLSYNGVKPTLQHLADGSYPLVKTLYLVVPATPSAAAKEFIRFIASARGRMILQSAGNLPLMPAGRR